MPTLPKPIEEWLLLTLDQMQSQHLFDHIHGGFYRYTIDPEWQTPHFEKMAYTSALLSQVYLHAGERFQRNDYLTTAKQTLHYLETHLYNPTTQLYQSSQSAIDAYHQEGGNYLWSKQALQKVLAPNHVKHLQQVWSLNTASPYQLGWHPKPNAKTPPKQWEHIRAQLQTDPKHIPTDSKSILSWNGLILSAYAKAYQTLKQPDYLQKGERLALRLSTLIQQKNPPRALSLNGQPMGEATLEDYAFIYQGLKDWQEAYPQNTLTNTLNTLKATLLNQFLSTTGWQYQVSPLLPGQQAEWQMKDNAIPSPTALVSCLAPKTLTLATHALMQRPIEYASYYQPLTLCPPK
ncbi:MAG TPA: thioredoxin domain-containing protein [Thiomicrorhabdus sp.]|nr:thioredoxin domain-containing protein [Thiomicrorhabdus sp.]